MKTGCLLLAVCWALLACEEPVEKKTNAQKQSIDTVLVKKDTELEKTKKTEEKINGQDTLVSTFNELFMPVKASENLLPDTSWPPPYPLIIPELILRELAEARLPMELDMDEVFLLDYYLSGSYAINDFIILTLYNTNQYVRNIELYALSFDADQKMLADMVLLGSSLQYEGYEEKFSGTFMADEFIINQLTKSRSGNQLVTKEFDYVFRLNPEGKFKKSITDSLVYEGLRDAILIELSWALNLVIPDAYCEQLEYGGSENPLYRSYSDILNEEEIEFIISPWDVDVVLEGNQLIVENGDYLNKKVNRIECQWCYNLLVEGDYLDYTFLEPETPCTPWFELQQPKEGIYAFPPRKEGPPSNINDNDRAMAEQYVEASEGTYYHVAEYLSLVRLRIDYTANGQDHSKVISFEYMYGD